MCARMTARIARIETHTLSHIRAIPLVLLTLLHEYVAAGCIGVTLTLIPLTSSTGSSTCTICPAGSECATLSADPVACGADSAAAAGSIACTQCDPGTAVTSADHCMSCIFIRCVIFMIPKFMSIICSSMLTCAFRVRRYHGLAYTYMC